jgi:ATP-dependent DNA ligase
VSPVDQPPEGKHWIHEIKHDGYRCQVLLEQGEARVFTRNGHDWTDRFPSIVRAAANLRCQSAILGDEAIVQNGNGASDFEAEQGLEGVVSKHALAPLSYAGAAFIALSGEDRTRFFAELERLATSWAVFKSSRLMDVKWCHPKLVVEVKHLAGGKLLRHATVKRLAT